MPEIEPGPLMGILVKEAYQNTTDESIHAKDVFKKASIGDISKQNRKIIK